MDDFRLDTNGHCFLCSEPNPSKWPRPCKPESDSRLDSAASSAPTHSVQLLSRYLKMDMRKVFNEGVPISPQLFAKVEKAKLKVELCEDCVSLNETFSNLYRKLEKVDMEVRSCVGRIHKKLLKATKESSSARIGLSNSKSSKQDDFIDARAEIVEKLRTDGMEKCVAKLRKASPRLRIQRLTMKQMDKKRSKLNTIARKNIAKNKNQTDNSPYLQDELDGVKMESQTSDLMSNCHNNEDSYLDYSDDMEAETLEQSTIDTEEERQIQMIKTESVELGAVSDSTEAVRSSPQSESRRPPPAEKKYIRNAVTGKYKCNRCSIEFNSASACRYHYNSVHIKTKFKCNLCGKEFTQRHHFQRHHKSIHVGVRLKCLGCNKLYKRKTDLNNHQKRTGCKVSTYGRIF